MIRFLAEPDRLMIKTPDQAGLFRSRRAVLNHGVGLGLGGLVSGCGSSVLVRTVEQLTPPPITPPPGVSDVENPQPVPFGSLAQASATVTSTEVGIIGSDFLGLSFEKSSLAATSLSTRDIDLVNRFKDLGARVLRIGGAAVDDRRWTPDGRQGQPNQISKLDVNSFAEFIQATEWKVIYGINLAQNDEATAADEAAYAAQKLGDRLYCFELGNEPDLYTNTYVAPNGTMTWTYALFKSKWESLRTAILARVSNATFAGPDAANNLATYTVPFAQQTGSAKLKILTQHHYRIKSGTPVADRTIPFLLVTPDPLLTIGTPGQGGEPARLPTLKAAAVAAGIPFRFTETNSAVNRGIDGVSNVYASALWCIDLMFTMAGGGAEGVNFHAGSASFYSPFDFANSRLTAIRPQYYGLLFFNMAGQGKLLETTINAGGQNISAYAIDTGAGTSVMFVNKSRQPFEVALQLPRPATTITAIYLAALDLTSTTGIKIQNAEISVSNGLGTMDKAWGIRSFGQSANVYVPPLTAVLVKAS